MVLALSSTSDHEQLQLTAVREYVVSEGFAARHGRLRPMMSRLRFHGSNVYLFDQPTVLSRWRLIR